eukprot:TRINITY_DN11795_c1_g3_i16.p2 TRINITY_DN11795_c1_g3~~TRINITY_DN11795_c1_g3_i16.p2  ORF type:complete len:471 (+),score=76.86 TRINITY_DN11795_c1_g3_i16:261-1673(+)
MTSAASLIPPQLKLLEAVEKPTTPAPALNPMAHKIVYLIRHGQSTANAAPSWEEAAKPEYRDASLTDLGKEQARALQDVVADWGVQTIYCSPMTRAMQTACLVFEKETAPLIAWPVITEFYPQATECKGRNPSEFSKDPNLTQLSRFAEVQLHGVGDDWWHVSGNRTGRIQTFLQWLSVCPETRIAIVCHWGFLHELLHLECDQKGLELSNCTHIRTVWESSKLSPLHPHLHQERMYGVFLMPSGEAEDDAGRQLYMELREFFRRCANDTLLQNTDTLRWGGNCAIPLTNCHTLPAARLVELKRTLRKTAGHADIRYDDAASPPAWRIQSSGVHRDSSLPGEKHAYAYVHFADQRLQSDAEALRKTLADMSGDDGSRDEIISPNRGKGFSLELVHFAEKVEWRATGPLTLQQFEAVVASDLPLVSALLNHDGQLEPAIKALMSMHWELCLASYGKDEGSHHLRLEAMYPY